VFSDDLRRRVGAAIVYENEFEGTIERFRDRAYALAKGIERYRLIIDRRDYGKFD
jgi:hypothetical protein